MAALCNSFPIGESLLPVTATEDRMLLIKLITCTVLRSRDHALPLALWKLVLAGYLIKANKVGWGFLQRLSFQQNVFFCLIFTIK